MAPPKATAPASHGKKRKRRRADPWTPIKRRTVAKTYIRQGVFNFLGLPRELRDMIYRLILADRKKPFFVSSRAMGISTSPAPKRKARPTHSKTRLLRVCKQVATEGKHILMEEHTFFVVMTNQTPCFKVRSAGLPSTHATPKGWCLDRLKSLCIHLRLQDDTGERLFRHLQFGRFDKLSKLRELHLIISWEPRPVLAHRSIPFREANPNLNNRYPGGSLAYRGMMRNLIASIPKSITHLKFSLGGKLESYREEYPGERWMDADLLQETFEEFRGLQGIDAEYAAEFGL